jgi:hypothetical protein
MARAKISSELHDAPAAAMERPLSTAWLRECIGPQPQSSKDVTFLVLAGEVDRLQAVQDLAIATQGEAPDPTGLQATKQEVTAILAASQRARTILVEGHGPPAGGVATAAAKAAV